MLSDAKELFVVVRLTLIITESETALLSAALAPRPALAAIDCAVDVLRLSETAFESATLAAFRAVESVPAINAVLAATL